MRRLPLPVYLTLVVVIFSLVTRLVIAVMITAGGLR